VPALPIVARSELYEACNVDFQTFGARAFKLTLLCKSLMRALFCFGLPSE
jgi:hypothetical protein